MLEHADVRFGLDGQLTVRGGELALSDSVLRNSHGAGLRIENSKPTLANVTFADNVGAAASMNLQSDPDLSGIAFSNNVLNAFALDSGVLTEDRAWDDPEVVYVLTDDVTAPAGRKLTVGAGQVIKGAAFTTDLIVDGTLEGHGSTAAPIVFTSLHDDAAGGDTNNNRSDTTPAQNNWGVILLRAAGNVLEHADVRYGLHGQLTVRGGTLDLSSSVVRDSSGSGVLVEQSAALTAVNNSIYANAGDGVTVASAATATLANNTIDGNLRGVNADGASATLANNLVTFNGDSGVRSANATVNLSFNSVHNPSAARGNYDGLPDATGQSGNASFDPRFFNRDNRQYQLRAGSRAIDSGTSDGDPPTDRLGNPRYDDPQVINAGGGQGPFVDRGAFERQEISLSNIDLATVAVSGPASGLAGQAATVDWTAFNAGSEPALGSWTDAVYLSSDPVWTPDDVLLGEAAHTGDLGPGQTYLSSATVTLPMVLPGDYYYLVRTNAQQDVFEGLALVNNAGASQATVAMDLPALAFGVPTDGTLDAQDDLAYYRINAPASADLSVALTGAARRERTLRRLRPTANAAIVRRPRHPARHGRSSGFRLRHARRRLLRTGLRRQIDRRRELYRRGFAPRLCRRKRHPRPWSECGRRDDCRPRRAVHGATSLRLVDSAGTTIDPQAVYFTDSGLLSATFDLRNRPLGAADVQVVNPANAVATLPGGFTIVAGAAGRLTTNVVAPSPGAALLATSS